jgi:hypothetical protein
MPVAGPPLSASAAGETNPRAAAIAYRLDPSDRRMLRMILLAVSTLVVLYLVALSFLRVGDLRQKGPSLVGRDQSYITLSSHDDLLGVTQKLGQPASDHQQETGTIFYRALGYPDRRYTVILMGPDRTSMTYIGTMDQNWHPIHFVNPRTESLLRQLPPSIAK